MSHRPIEQKKRRRVAKALRRQALPAYFDLFQWLVDHKHVKTRREARELILAGRVKNESHVVGIEDVPTLMPDFKVEEVPTAMRYLDAKLRPRITVAAA